VSSSSGVPSIVTSKEGADEVVADCLPVSRMRAAPATCARKEWAHPSLPCPASAWSVPPASMILDPAPELCASRFGPPTCSDHTRVFAVFAILGRSQLSCSETERSTLLTAPCPDLERPNRVLGEPVTAGCVRAGPLRGWIDVIGVTAC